MYSQKNAIIKIAETGISGCRFCDFLLWRSFYFLITARAINDHSKSKTYLYLKGLLNYKKVQLKNKG